MTDTKMTSSTEETNPKINIKAFEEEFNQIAQKSKNPLWYTSPSMRCYNLTTTRLSTSTSANYTSKSENRPCHKSQSLVHLLKCGHLVYTPQLSLCGRTCMKPKEGTARNAGLYCVLCYRHLEARGAKHARRWWNLLLPRYVDEEAEAADWEVHKSVLRPTKPCYIHGGAMILSPETKADIALIRILCQREEGATIQQITNLCNQLGHTPDSITQTHEFFDQLLTYHHALHLQRLPAIAAKAIHLSLKHDGGLEIELGPILNAFSSNLDELTDGMWQANNMLRHRAAEDVAQYFVAKCGRAIRHLVREAMIRNAEKAKASTKISPMQAMETLGMTAMRIWTRLFKSKVFQPRERRVKTRLIVASCLHQAMLYHRVRDVKVMKVLVVLDIAQTNEFDDVYKRVKKFATGTDWTMVILKRKKDRRGVLLKRAEQQSQELGGLDDLMAMSGL